MKMKTDKSILTTTIICLMPIILSLVVYNKLPEQIAIHFDSLGNPDNYLPKPLAAFGLPFLMAVINCYIHFRLNFEPKNQNLSLPIKTIIKWSAPVISIILIPITLFMAMGSNIPITTIGKALVGIVIVMNGNYLPKCKHNYSVGIRLPWTLADEDNWIQTHRVGGFIWVIGGLIIIADAFIKLSYLTTSILILLVVIPFIYSFIMMLRSKGNI